MKNQGLRKYFSKCLESQKMSKKQLGMLWEVEKEQIEILEALSTRWQYCLQGDISENGDVLGCYNEEEEGVIGIYQEGNRNAGCPAAWNNVT